jgi:hypothetical protein
VLVGAGAVVLVGAGAGAGAGAHVCAVVTVTGAGSFVAVGSATGASAQPITRTRIRYLTMPISLHLSGQLCAPLSTNSRSSHNKLWLLARRFLRRFRS